MNNKKKTLLRFLIYFSRERGGGERRFSSQLFITVHFEDARAPPVSA